MSMTVTDALQTLELGPNYSLDELEQARKTFKSKYHPDKAGNDELKRELMAQKYADGQEAYDVLKSNLPRKTSTASATFTTTSSYSTAKANAYQKTYEEMKQREEEKQEKDVETTPTSTYTFTNDYSTSPTSSETKVKIPKKKMGMGKKIFLIILAILFVPSIASCVFDGFQGMIGVNFDSERGKAGIDFEYTDIKSASDVGVNYLGEGKYSVGVALKNENSSFTLKSAKVKFTAYNELGSPVGSGTTTVELPIAPGDVFYAGTVISDCNGAAHSVKATISSGDTEWYISKNFVYNNPLVVDSATVDEEDNYEAVVVNTGDAYIGETISASIVYMKDGLPIYACEDSASVKLEPGDSCTISGEGYNRELITGFDDILVKVYKRVK